MPKMSLLDMVQNILSDMDSDEVNSINDTTEAMQVAEIIRTSYYHIMADGDWPHLGEMFQLDASASMSKPTHMKIPDDTRYVSWIKYNKVKSSGEAPKYADVTYLEPEKFVGVLNSRNPANGNVIEVVDDSGVGLFILNDRPPTYYTSFDNAHVVLDSYTSTIESTLQKNKTQAYRFRDPVFNIVDEFVPDLPAKAFPFLLAEAKSSCFNALKQAANPKEEEKAQMQRRRLSQERWKLQGGIKYSSYGRRSVK